MSADKRVSLRASTDDLEAATRILEMNGVSLNGAFNMFLKQVRFQGGLPFSIALPRESTFVESQIDSVTNSLRISANEAVNDGMPIAMYDPERKKPYMLYPNGEKVY